MKDWCGNKTINGRAFYKAYNILNNIDNIKDLKKHFNSLSDYNSAWAILQSYQRSAEERTFIKSVADFFKKCGFDVSYDGINYIIE